METAADPASMVALLADATRIPGWAPAFADAVSSAGGSGWRAVKDGRDFTFRTAVSLDAGTVDYLREIAPGREGGAYLRVVPPGTDPAGVAATLEDELAALKNLAEGG
jgi:hypothetical protein